MIDVRGTLGLIPVIFNILRKASCLSESPSVVRAGMMVDVSSAICPSRSVGSEYQGLGRTWRSNTGSFSGPAVSVLSQPNVLVFRVCTR